jgi:hypothetical protein
MSRDVVTETDEQLAQAPEPDGTVSETASCCAPVKQASCCEPSEKASCCGQASSGGCGCQS